MDPIPRLNAALEGRYHIERQLGEGGMATVYLAQDLKHERKVALKVLKPELAAVVGAERFLAEIKTTANLQHPHILPLHDSGNADGFLFYVMPYVEGESLRERLDRERQLPVDEAVRIAIHVAEALDYAHRHGVIHRDIKPANILLQDGAPVISDFGIALAVGAAGGGRLTETGLSLGTPHYMSPEQATGDLSVGAASDIYALGCVLYEMLVGDPPYVGSTAQAILGKIVTGDADPVTRHRRAVPTHVDAAIRRALEKVPADRFSSAQDFAKALSDPAFRHGASRDVVAAAGSASSLWNPLTSALAVVAVALGVALTWTAARPAPALPETTRLSIMVPADHVFACCWSPSRKIALSPDGRDLVYVGRPGGPGSPRLYVRSIDDPTIRELPGTEAARQLFFSPNGEWIAFFTTPGELKKVRLDGGSALTLASDLDGAVWRFGTWTDAGELVMATLGGGLRVVPEEGGPVQPLITSDADSGEGVPLEPHWVPGTRAVLFSVVAPDGESHIEVVDLDTHERRVVVERGRSPLYLASGDLLYVQDETPVVRPFDAKRLEVSGPAVPLGDDVLVEGGIPQWTASRSGTFIYRPSAASGSMTLGVVDREGNFESLEEETDDIPAPRVSADGRYVAFNLPRPSTGIGLYDVVGRSAVRVEGLAYPAWLPDGRTMSATRNRFELVLRQADGSTEALVGGSSAAFLRNASWSYDGTVLAYTAQTGEEHDIWTVTPGQEPRLLIGGRARQYGPSFSPDGHWIAYVSTESGRAEVYVKPYPDGPALPVTTGGGSGVRWSPVGDELFIDGNYEGTEVLMGIPVGEAGGTLELGEPEPLFETSATGANGTTIRYRTASNSDAQFDVFPDGQRFVIARRIEDPPRELIIVQGFFEDLRERLGEN